MIDETTLLARVESVPGVQFRYYPALLGFWRLTALVRAYPARRRATLDWGWACGRRRALRHAEAMLIGHGALQPPPERQAAR